MGGDEQRSSSHLSPSHIVQSQTTSTPTPIPTPTSSSYPETNFTSGAKWIKSLTKDRLGQFVGGHFNEVNLGAVLFFERRDDEKHVQMKMWSAPGKAKPSFDDVMKLEDKDWKEATKGVKIGPSCESHLGYALTNHWFKVHLNIPSGWNKYERIQLEFDPGCEAMIFETDGNPLQGITGGYDGDRRVDFIIPKEARRKGSIDVIIEVSANGMFGISGVGPPDPNRYFSLASADLVVPNQEGWRLLWDFNTLRELVDDLGGDSILQNKCLYVANKIMNTFDVKESDRTIKECREIAEEVFGKGWDAKGGRVYEEGLGEGKHKKRAQVWGIGNCHIDTAWLWPYSVTQQKAARSWATQLDLMDRYPEHRFAASTAQQFKWVEQLYPKLFERIQAKVKTGQFQLVGGSWVENDSNMPSGEALARQMIFGQRYFRSRFGVTCKVAWLPDSFGYSAGFPQLMRGCGMANFFTQKLSWNNVNTFPHSTFNWVGNDGTQVLCHMTPVGTYTAQATTSDNLESSDTGLLAFGNGDGGGGPLNKMLENLRRIRATANENRELPIVHMGNSVDEFFEDIHQTTDEGKTLPTWHGELYLEFHRATYTSHGSIKKGNRHSERLLRDVEYLATMASVYHPDDYQYPKERIDIAWEKVLLNQFHDGTDFQGISMSKLKLMAVPSTVLPGSAIGMVYEDAEVLYSEVTKVGKQIIDEALDVLLKHSLSLESVALGTTERVEGDIAVINSTPFHRRELVQVPLSIGWTDSPGKRVAQDMHNRKLGYAVADVAGKMVCGLAPLHGRASARNIGKGEFQLKNEHVEMRISGGRIVGLFDVKAGRELIPQGQTGGMVMFERDMPSYWDAWDAEIHHLETSRPLEFTNVSIFEAGPARATLAAEISLDAVTATTADSSRPFIRFAAKVDWHERHKFLKFEIPVDIHADTAYFESAFGHVSRPTNKNTTQEAAKFEVCGHRFADLSEFGYGVALLTESKYGYAVSGNVMRLSLLRGATSPDAEQDQGVRFMPKSLQSDIAQSPLSTASPFIVENASNVILDTVKRGDDDSSDGDPTIILRFYEAYGGHARANVMISDKLHVSKATITNLLEEDAESLDLLRSNISDAGTSFALCFRGFQVITVQKYVDLILKEQSEWANWQPGTQIELGDYGLVNDDGIFEAEGNLYKSPAVKRNLAKQQVLTPPQTGKREGQLIITSSNMRRVKFDLAPHVNIASVAQASITGKWEVPPSQCGALLVIHQPRTDSLPSDIPYADLAKIPELAGKSLVTKITVCPAYVLYLSSTNGDTISLALSATVPIPDAPAVGAGGSLGVDWSVSHGSGIFREGTSATDDYRPLFSLRKFKGPSLFTFGGGSDSDRGRSQDKVSSKMTSISNGDCGIARGRAMEVGRLHPDNLPVLEKVERPWGPLDEKGNEKVISK
ncbi:Glycoside hydrolase, 38 vacuolar alpha mannosidase [Tulasnella sp. 332]|nr:Glycoside hydrolase, 38 vacuolar alpha mannosidase [Tulasnella sp. 332]